MGYESEFLGKVGLPKALYDKKEILTSAGADGRICLFDVENGTQQMELLHEEEMINCLVFSPSGYHLLCGSKDGTITAIDMKNLTVDKSWDAHDRAVLCIIWHPEENLILSVGADFLLHAGDLKTGKTIYAKRLHKNPRYGRLLLAAWSSDGIYLALATDNVVDVISMETNKSVRMVSCSSRPLSISWISEWHIVVGLFDGFLLTFNIEPGNFQHKKMIRVFDSSLVTVVFAQDHLAMTSSDCEISLWRVDENNFEEICTRTVDYLPTCLVLVGDKPSSRFHDYVMREWQNKKRQLRRIRIAEIEEEEYSLENAYYATKNYQAPKTKLEIMKRKWKIEKGLKSPTLPLFQSAAMKALCKKKSKQRNEKSSSLLGDASLSLSDLVKQCLNEVN
ncbi:uncharacterized protein LOC128745755 [Sabethes cyaneus]|uniref:uncharacterized protein LOC128745755 n=1 Tax=Sabethes cyaneus TaxID=53552 RepID=UPI00237DE2A4|nr:uncharacterized protein LOC128745755 [Sabethes cyaneus]